MNSRLMQFFKPAPFAWSSRELFFMRLAFSLVVVFFAVTWQLNAFQPEPDKLNGLAKVMPLAWMLNPAALITLKILTIVGLALFVLGVAPVLSLLPPLFTVVGLGALRNSKGDISHSTQSAAMALLAIWVAYLFVALVKKSWKKPGKGAHQSAMLAALMIFAASYVASGIVKLKASDGKWIQRVPNMAVQMVKSNLADYYSKPEGEVSALMTQTAPKFFTDNPLIAKSFFGVGLVLELGAMVLLLGRRWALVWGGALLLMHIGISVIMDIEFWNHMGLLTILCVIPGLTGLFAKKSKQADSLETAVVV